MPRGFTLIELLVVIFILSLVLAIAFPAFRTTEGKVRSEAGKTATLLRGTYETSAYKKQTLALEFDMEEGIVRHAGGELRLETLYGVELQSRGLVKEGSLTVFFNPMGMQDFIWVYLGSGEEGMTVTFNPLSGRVKTMKGHGQA